MPSAADRICQSPPSIEYSIATSGLWSSRARPDTYGYFTASPSTSGLRLSTRIGDDVNVVSSARSRGTERSSLAVTLTT